MTQNEHVYAICCRAEVDDDGRNVKTMEVYVVGNFEAASSGNFQDIPKRLFCDGDVATVAAA